MPLFSSCMQSYSSPYYYENRVAISQKNSDGEGIEYTRENSEIYKPIQNGIIKLPTGDYGRFYALIIGNNKYTFLPRLKTAVNDAKAVDDILTKQYGFKTKLLLNASRADILKSLNKYRMQLTEKDNLFIYYAGHGWLDEQGDEGYWLPIDAEKNLKTNWLANSTLSTEFKAMKAKHVLVVADSCFSGKLGRGLRIQHKDPDYLHRIASKRMRSVISSGGLEPVVDGNGKGNHSVFCSALLDALRENKGVIDGTHLFGLIRRPVMVNSDQTPEYSDIRKAGHDGGDFLFIKK